MKLQILALTLACEALGATHATAQTDRFDGVFKPRGAEFTNWDCKTIGQDGGAVAIRNGEIWGVESFCKIAKPVPVNGMDAVLYEAECGGEGYEWKERIMLMKADFGVYYITDKFVAEWQYCALK
jgi:hypothetical protein